MIVLQGAEVTCTAGGRGHVYIGDSAGCVHGLNRQLKITSFEAHSEPVRCITAFDHTNIVITIAVSHVSVPVGILLQLYLRLTDWLPTVVYICVY